MGFELFAMYIKIFKTDLSHMSKNNRIRATIARGVNVVLGEPRVWRPSPFDCDRHKEEEKSRESQWAKELAEDKATLISPLEDLFYKLCTDITIKIRIYIRIGINSIVEYNRIAFGILFRKMPEVDGVETGSYQKIILDLNCRNLE